MIAPATNDSDRVEYITLAGACAACSIDNGIVTSNINLRRYCSAWPIAGNVSFSLKCNGIDAYVDCYEDDDGSDGGRPIIRKIYSVKIKNY